MSPFRILESCGHRHRSLEAADACCAQVGRESGHRILSTAFYVDRGDGWQVYKNAPEMDELEGNSPDIQI
jgi:hypothetical protein